MNIQVAVTNYRSFVLSQDFTTRRREAYTREIQERGLFLLINNSTVINSVPLEGLCIAASGLDSQKLNRIARESGACVRSMKYWLISEKRECIERREAALAANL